MESGNRIWDSLILVVLGVGMERWWHVNRGSGKCCLMGGLGSDAIKSWAGTEKAGGFAFFFFLGSFVLFLIFFLGSLRGVYVVVGMRFVIESVIYIYL